MTLRGKANIFTIAPGAPFLPTLAASLVNGTLIAGFEAKGDPLLLASATIYVPTRRAARALRSEFAQLSGSGAAILPVIRPLGEFDEDFDAAPDGLDLAPPIGREQRLIELARLVRAWAKHLPDTARSLFGTDPMVLPASNADAVWLARSLADLMDEAEREGGDWSRLKELVPDDLAHWWQLTLGFMEIVTRQWPEHLAASGFSDPVSHRNALIRREAERLRTKGSKGPVIAAGSTGSMPATAELLKVVSRLNNGALVLPGLDKELDPAAWDLLALAAETPSVFGHPQFGLRKLLDVCGATREDVETLGEVYEPVMARNRTISLALLPADHTGIWAAVQNKTSRLEAVCEIVAPTETSEALAIAIALREAVELGHTPAALVTADRTLARRVSAELERFGILADDSGGMPLEHTPPATLFLTMLGLAFGQLDPASLLSLLQHPLTALGKERPMARRGAEVADLTLLRGEVLPLQVDAVLAHMRMPEKNEPKEERKRPFAHRFDPGEIETAVDLGQALFEALQPLQDLKALAQVDVAQACTASVKAFEAIGLDAKAGLSRLYGGEAGEQFAGLLASLCGLKSEFQFPPAEWPTVFRAFMSGQSVKPAPGADPRVFIWGALEARLQTLETVILGGLNETVWPQRPADDPFLSRSMKAKVALDPPERRTGLAAHDFQMLMGHPHVILSRSARRDRAPTVPSRWLQRLHALVGGEETKAMQARGQVYLDWAEQIDQGEKTDRIEPPKPKPPVDLRPKHFSVTDIETLRRDPYAIHARKILGLEPLPDLVREPDARERGTLFHTILERFVEGREAAPGKLDDLIRIGREEFDKAQLPPDMQALWWRRFEKSAAAFLEIEAEHAQTIMKSVLEIKSATVPIGDTGVTLSGRADRIDILKDGTAAIIDYKTGSSSSAQQAKILLAPQLPLEAAMLKQGAFAGLEHMQASELAYVQLKPNCEVKREAVANDGGKLQTATELGDIAWEKLEKLIRHYGNQTAPYLSRVLPVSTTAVGDYDHLARVAEWSAGGGEDGDDGS